MGEILISCNMCVCESPYNSHVMFAVYHQFIIRFSARVNTTQWQISAAVDLQYSIMYSTVVYVY